MCSHFELMGLCPLSLQEAQDVQNTHTAQILLTRGRGKTDFTSKPNPAQQQRTNPDQEK